MRAELPAISFVCAVLIAVFIPVRRVRCNVANLAIVSWLVGCNVVHGANAIIWAGNVDIHVPVWCDLVTKLLLGAQMALPGACLCISRRLELVASTRPISNDPKSQRNRLLIEFLFCYIIPVMYMALHLIAQDHRFDLVKDIGCSASIHPSTPVLILIWVPPIIICAISFILSGLAIHRSFRLPFARFSSHLESRSPLNTSLFVRRIAVSLLTTCTIFIVSLFSVFSISGFRPWTSWASVHAEFAVIDVVQSRDDIKSIQLAWWGIPAVSIVYILLSFLVGEEARDAAKWIRGIIIEMSKPRPRPLIVLPTHVDKAATEMVSRSQSLSTPRPKPQALDLKSGWDDMLVSKKPKLWSPGRRSPTSLRAMTPSPSPTSASASPSSAASASEDEAFIASTANYLGSPIAKTLGISPPALILSPPPAYVSPRKVTQDRPQTPTPTRPVPPMSPLNLHDIPPSPRRVPDDVESVISSVFDARWPQPPASVPPSIAHSKHRSRSASPAEPSATDATFGYPLYPSITPPHKHSKPFEGSSISSVSDIVVPVLPQTRPKRGPSVKNLRRKLSGEKVGYGYAPGDVIYMTVVKETV
uniref:Mating-type protein STE3.s1 n=1 Tax=Hypsizygus marmoreus TaxID=39966 RepID=A0A7T7ILU0_HYPMA|nr:mating-type protein STE3.s1 [Hypsizygus marmoreus]